VPATPPLTAAVLIGAASAPQAAASGFHAPYTIPNTATAALGVLLTVTVLATAGQTRPPGQFTGKSCPIGGAFGDAFCYGTLTLAFHRGSASDRRVDR
jgi:hypothetical protein